MIDWSRYKHIVPHIAVGSGVIDTVADWVCDGGFKKLLVVCDPNTLRVAGEYVLSQLKAAGVDADLFCFAEDEPLPDEHSVGRILTALSKDTGLILGVGSGTINDLCTYVGFKVKCPSAIVGTVPSMDGYASLGSAMLFSGVKFTPPTQCPVAIFCDTDILAKAPMRLIAAGLGDMLGKITSLTDWKLSHIVTGEPMPDDIFELMQGALDKVILAAPKASERDNAAIESLTEGLILSGIAMSLYGDSRPASGTEHHLAHFFELRTRKHELHGTKVGLGTVMALVAWKKLLRSTLDGNSSGQCEQDIHQLFTELGESLPEPETVIALLSKAGMTVSPKALGLSTHDVCEGVLYAKDRKPTYTLLQHLSRAGLLEEYADAVNNYFAERAISDIKCFVLDMDGTIYLGDRLFPFTPGFLVHLKSQGKDYVFFTNNSSQNAAHYINKLRRMGIGIDSDRLLMSTHVLLDYLASISAPKKVFVAGTRALMDDFEAAGYTLTGYSDGDDKPDFAVLGFDTDMDYDRLTRLCDFAREGLPVYGVNMDYNCPIDGGFIPDCGSLAAALYASAGVSVDFFGKPSRRALDYIIKTTGYAEDELCFVGDRLYTDIAITDGTKARSVLVLSGETKREDVACSKSVSCNTLHIPDLVVDDLRGLQEMI